jgi:tetratricopeptide (TPR) repeat protein
MRIRPAFIASMSLSLLLSGVALAISNPNYDQGLALFNQGRFAQAITAFQAASKVDPRNVNCYYYMASSYQQLGRTKDAATYYHYIVRYFPSSTQAGQANLILAKIAPQSTHTLGATSSVTATSQVVTPQSVNTEHAVKRAGKIDDLIKVYKPLAGRPAVSDKFVAQVKSALSGFPPQAIAAIREGGGMIHLTPTLIDRNPELKNTRPRGYEEGHTYKNCPAMFDYPNIVVCEYAIVGDDDDDKWELTDDPIGSMRHEMGHALDAFLGGLTQTEEYKHAYYLDLGKVDQDMREKLHYYTQKAEGGPSETFAELVCALYGGGTTSYRNTRCQEVFQCFPTMSALIKNKINSL